MKPKPKTTQKNRGEWLYGRRIVMETLVTARREIRSLHLTDEIDDDYIQIAQHLHIPIVRTDRKSLTETLGEVNHQGIALNVSPYPYVSLEEIIANVRDDDEAIVIILDHIEDPQNVGSILRTANAIGATGVIIPEDRASGVTPAAVRASAGASEHLKIAKVVNLPRAIEALKSENSWVTGLDWGDDAKPYDKIDYRGRVTLVIGNEGNGITRLVRDKCDFIAVLPMRGEVSSLNASVAAGITMYEILRTKLQK